MFQKYHSRCIFQIHILINISVPKTSFCFCILFLLQQSYIYVDKCIHEKTAKFKINKNVQRIYKTKTYDCEFLEDTFKYELVTENGEKVFRHIREFENVLTSFYFQSKVTRS